MKPEQWIDPYKGDIEKDYGIITRGMKTGGAPAYTPIFYTPWI